MRLPALPVACLLIASLLVAVPGAQAQEPSLILWGHGNADDGEIIWMNDDGGDKRATDTANGPGYCPDPFSLTTCPANSPVAGSFDHTFTLAMDPALGAPATLVDGRVTFAVALGANSGECSGTITNRISNGAGVVAEAAPLDFSYASGYDVFTTSADVVAQELGDAADLVWEIEVACDGDGLFLGVHRDTGRTFLALPVAGGATESGGGEETVAGLIEGVLDEGSAVLRIDAGNVTTASYRYTWVNPFPAFGFNASLNGTGLVTYRLADEANATALAGTLDGTMPVGEVVTDALPGNWTLAVDLDSVQGIVQIILLEPDTAVEDAATTEVDVPPPDKDASAPGALLALAVAGSLAVARVRRR